MSEFLFFYALVGIISGFITVFCICFDSGNPRGNIDKAAIFIMGACLWPLSVCLIILGLTTHLIFHVTDYFLAIYTPLVKTWFGDVHD